MNKHTPGPWTASRSATKASNFGGYVASVTGQDERGPCTVAKVRGGNFDDAEHATSNAAFIVLACNTHGDLLAALKATVAVIDDEVAAGDDGADTHPVIKAHAKVADRARAVIAKAEGR